MCICFRRLEGSLFMKVWFLFRKSALMDSFIHSFRWWLFNSLIHSSFSSDGFLVARLTHIAHAWTTEGRTDIKQEIQSKFENINRSLRSVMWFVVWRTYIHIRCKIKGFKWQWYPQLDLNFDVGRIWAATSFAWSKWQVDEGGWLLKKSPGARTFWKL